MRIESIKITGLKGAAGETVDLSSATFFAGPNGAGKSTVIDGLRLLLRGEHPDAGRGGVPAKRADDILALAAGDEIEVEGVLSTPAGRITIGRRWERTEQVRGAASGKITTSATAWVVDPSGRRIDQKKAAEARIAEIVGPSAGLDLADLLGPSVTDSARRTLLLSAAGVRSTWTPEAVAEDLARREVSPESVRPWRGTPADPAIADWLQAEWERISAEVARAHTELLRAREAAEKIQQGQVDAGQSVDPLAVQRAQEAVAAAEERGRSVEARATRATVSARSALERGQQADTQRRATQAHLTSTREQIARLAAAAGESPRVAELEQLLEDADDELQDGSLPSLRGRLASTRAEIDRLEGEIATAGQAEQSARVAADRAEGAWRAAQQRAAEWRAGEQAEIARRCAAEQAALDSATLAAEPTRAIVAAVHRLLDEAEDRLEDEAPCPTCGALIDRPRLAELERASLIAGEPVSAAKVALYAAREDALADVRLVRAELEGDAQTARDASAVAAAAVAPLASRTLALVRDRQEAQRVARETEASLSRAESTVGRWREELAHLRASTADAQIATLRERERALAAEVAAIHVPDLAGLEASLDQAESQARRERQQAADDLAEARAVLIPLESALTLQREVLRLRREVDGWESAWREAQRVERAIGPAGLMGAVLAEIIGPLEGLANEGLAGLGLGKLVVRLLDERGRPVCRPGLERDGLFSPVETLSDGERASVLPVLLPAIATLIGSPWRLLVADSLERLDSARREVYVRRVVALVAEGRIDQALLAGCPDRAPEIQGCTVITVGS